MKLAHPDIDNNIIIEDGEVFELIIENHSLFYSVISDIALQIQKADGKTILSKDNKPISISSNVEFITDYVFFDLNQKTLLTKILSYLEKRALDSNHYSKQQELLCHRKRQKNQKLLGRHYPFRKETPPPQNP